SARWQRSKSSGHCARMNPKLLTCASRVVPLVSVSTGPTGEVVLAQPNVCRSCSDSAVDVGSSQYRGAVTTTPGAGALKCFLASDGADGGSGTCATERVQELL